MHSTLYEVIEELKGIFPDFEERKEQMEMWETVFESMANGEKTAIHAPTGTGKSLGYILPYIARKLEDPKFKITISTFTINLQEQLKNDLELGIRIYQQLLAKRGEPAKKISYAVLKGQKNYFCKQRYLESAELDPYTLDLVEQKLVAVREWDKQHLELPIPHKEWEMMQVEECTKRKCQHHSSCTYFRHYHSIDEKDVVITNHTLWFTRFYFVEPWDAFQFHVFDEGHKLEKTLLETYTFNLSAKKLESWVEQGERIAGKFGADESEIAAWKERSLHKHPAVHAAHTYLNKLELELTQPNQTLHDLKLPEDEPKQVILALSAWQKNFYEEFTALIPPSAFETEELKESLKNWVRTLLSLKTITLLALHEKNIGLFWAEKDARGQAILNVTPRDLHSIPNSFKKGTLITSGTLAENRSCQSFANRIRVKLDHDLVLTSPFPLNEQTQVYISEGLNPKNTADYEDRLENEIYELLLSGKQKAFILFTSNKLMWTMFKRMNQKLRSMKTYNDQSVELWIQDKTNHKQVVASFKNKSVRSILFGTLSYFEGIDLKGDSLTQIILTRLPYSVPTHPIQQILDAKHGYSSWEAIVRYEQAFGRLIRTGYDYGTFNILDNRVRYLRQFLHMFEAENIPVTTNIEDVRTFYSRH